MICADCMTSTLCEVAGCQLQFNKALVAKVSRQPAPLQLTEDMLVSDKAPPAPPPRPPDPVITVSAARLPNTDQLMIKEGFLGGWLIQLPDGKFAVAQTPDELGKIIAAWATK